MKTHSEGPYVTLVEETTDALLDKEHYLIAQGTAEGSCKLATSTDDAIGVLYAKREGDPHVTVRLLGKGGTVKVIAGGVIAKDARVIWGTGGKVITRPTSAGTHRTLGRKMSQGNSASGDIIEILDLVEKVSVVTVVALTSTDGTAAGAADLAALKAESEKIGDDVRAIHAALVTAGIISAS